MKDINNLFPSFTVSFENQADFNMMAEIRSSFKIIDISWSERIFNFEDEEEREKFVQVATGYVYKIKRENILFGD